MEYNTCTIELKKQTFSPLFNKPDGIMSNELILKSIVLSETLSSLDVLLNILFTCLSGSSKTFLTKVLSMNEWSYPLSELHFEGVPLNPFFYLGLPIDVLLILLTLLKLLTFLTFLTLLSLAAHTNFVPLFQCSKGTEDVHSTDPSFLFKLSLLSL